MTCGYQIYEVVSMAYFSLTLMIYCDLYFILKNPFKPQMSRLFGYYLFVLITCLLILTATFMDYFKGSKIYYFYTFVFVTYLSVITYT